MIQSLLTSRAPAPVAGTAPATATVWGSTLGRVLGKPLCWLLATVLVLGQWFALPAAWATSLYQLPAAPTEATWVLDEPEVLSRLTAIQLRDDLKAIAQDTGDRKSVV